MSARAVIFDVDGVLVDSYAAHLASWQELAREVGVPFTEADFAAGFGQTSRQVLEHHFGAAMRDRRQLALLEERKEASYRRSLSRSFPAMEGAARLIDELRRAGFRLAVGSSGPTENIELVLEGLQRARSFDAVVTGRDVARGKPDPQVFLLAAERLGVEPRRCVVIEDAPAGLQAARAAGMACIGLISTGRRREDLEAADLAVESLRELNVARISAILDQTRP